MRKKLEQQKERRGMINKNNPTENQTHILTTNSHLKSSKSTYAYILNASDTHTMATSAFEE